MTRFARAKGSKASNERREEDATPWHVMRQQLTNQLGNNKSKFTEDLSQIVKNVTSSYLEHSNEIWSDFGESKPISEKNKKGNIIKNRESKSQNKKQLKLVESNVTNGQSTTEQNLQIGKLHEVKIGKKLNVKSDNHSQSKKKLNKTNNNDSKNIKISEINIEKDDVSNEIGLDSFSSNNFSQHELIKKTEVKSHNGKSQKIAKPNNSIHQKNFNGSSFYTIVANGREIKIVRYDGFLIKKDDAERLKILRKKLKSENIPTDKIKAIMKLERRKAEKALAREKNTVCFHCRKFGHNFADCPDIKESEASKSGMCFKCGSTEHTHFQCKVTQNQNFRYAVCFVCKEQGHIARQCTLNPQGQYPKGGSCHLCGEVTHLRKDCPKAVEEKPSNTLTVNSLKNRKLEDIDELEPYTKNPDQNKRKLVKF